MPDYKGMGRKGGQQKAANRKLTDDQVRQVRVMLKENQLSGSAIGRHFGCGPDTIRSIRDGFNYRDVV